MTINQQPRSAWLTLGKARQADLLRWMEEHEYKSIREMQGSMSQRAGAEPSHSSAPITSRFSARMPRERIACEEL